MGPGYSRLVADPGSDTAVGYSCNLMVAVVGRDNWAVVGSCKEGYLD